MYTQFNGRADLALEAMFNRPEATQLSKNDPEVFILTGCADRDGIRYGSYKTVKKSSLVGREYIVDWSDYRPSIFYTDVWHNPRTHKNEPK